MVQLKPDSDRSRVIKNVPLIMAHLARLPATSHEIAYRSSDGLTFGVFFQSDHDPSKLQATLPATTYFENGDALIVVEVGTLKAGSGMSRAWTWLQRHP